MRALILSEMRTDTIRDRFKADYTEVFCADSWEEFAQKLGSGMWNTIVIDGYDIALREKLRIRRTDEMRFFGGR